MIKHTNMKIPVNITITFTVLGYLQNRVTFVIQSVSPFWCHVHSPRSHHESLKERQVHLDKICAPRALAQLIGGRVTRYTYLIVRKYSILCIYYNFKFYVVFNIKLI